MTIKIVSELKQNNPALFAEVEKRLKAIPGSAEWYMKLTAGELQRLANFVEMHSMNFTSEQERYVFDNLEPAERNVVDMLIKQSGDDVIKKVQSICKTKNERSKRYIESIIEDISAEQEIEQLVSEAKSNRTSKKSDVQRDWERVKSIFL
ncbi:hypothetical protein [Methylomarinum vadi]|uniref:hypothetical protein n=1 Tax=Methylomarinum vadi TaxID=438855 RepID=UPI0004DF9D9D|nr:hypothetical protein [Methylomarinum vadi]